MTERPRRDPQTGRGMLVGETSRNKLFYTFQDVLADDALALAPRLLGAGPATAAWLVVDERATPVVSSARRAAGR